MYQRVRPPPLVAWNDFMWIFNGHVDVMSHFVRLFVVFFSITLVCSFPDVQTDTSALDAYRPSRCGCTCPILSKVCPLCFEQQRTETLDSLCGALLPLFLLPSSPFSFSTSFSGQHPMRRALHCARRGVIHRNTLLLLSVVILLF